MNHIMTFLLFFSPEKMIYSHHPMLGVRPLSPGNVLILLFAFITFIWIRPDPENTPRKS
jgi:hypothetical protein